MPNISGRLSIISLLILALIAHSESRSDGPQVFKLISGASGMDLLLKKGDHLEISASLSIEASFTLRLLKIN